MQELEPHNKLHKLHQQVAYVTSNSAFYQKHFKGFELNNFSLTDFKKLPFTNKQHLADYNSEFLCVPVQQVAEYATTSGTSGSPVTVFLTKNDLSRLAKNEKHSFETIGATKEDVFQLMTTIDKQFMAGLAYYLGVQELGAGMIRIGPGVPSLQWESIEKYKPTVLIAVPSFLVALLSFAKQHQINPNTSSVKAIICIGEPIRKEDLTNNVLAERILNDWDVKLYSTYASTEMGAAFTECSAQQGGHLNEDLIYLEVLDENGKEVEDGEVGEIVVTTLGNEGMPLIRYQTGDIAHVYRNTCSCGRKTPRLGPILTRKNQMIKYKGTTIFPPAIFEIFDSRTDISCYKIEVSKDYLGNDTLTILLENTIENTSVHKEIMEECSSKLRVVPHFVFLESEYLRSQVFKKHMRKPEKIIFK